MKEFWLLPVYRKNKINQTCYGLVKKKEKEEKFPSLKQRAIVIIVIVAGNLDVIFFIFIVHLSLAA